VKSGQGEIAAMFRTMGKMSKRPTIGEAVTSFMVAFGNSTNSQDHARWLIERLRQDPAWTPAEVEELRRRLESRLSKRAS
jgi:hypothetical protein